MRPADDERREAARKLREIADEDEWIVVKLAAAFGIDLMRCESREEGEAEVVRRIADLIDPTCDFLPTFDGGFGCDRCYTWFNSMETKPNYCPHCGARVVQR